MHDPRRDSPRRPQAPAEQDKPLMRSLGEFFGHIVQGIKTDVEPSKKVVTKQTVEEESHQTPDGTVILRRTIIEEVEVPKRPAGALGPPDPGQGSRGA